MDLNSAGDAETRFFVFDLGAPGLAASRLGADPFDITWRSRVTRTRYDGVRQGQTLSQEEYRERFQKDEAQYIKVLRILLSTEAHGRARE